MKSVGILVVYDKGSAINAINAFQKLLLFNFTKPVIIVVCNNPDLFSSIVSSSYTKRIHFVSGHNDLREFSGMQAGIDWYCHNYNDYARCLWILANDTFCKHHSFSKPEDISFFLVSKLTSMTHSEYIIGEVNRLESATVLAGSALEKWISTYLFIISPSAMRLLDYTVVFGREYLDLFFSGLIDEDNFFSDLVKGSLRNRLIAWQFGRPSMPKWYNCEPLSVYNYESQKGKAISILSEKLLSCRASKLGIKLIDWKSAFITRFVKKTLDYYHKYRRGSA
jgi:hypothetical protein